MEKYCLTEEEKIILKIIRQDLHMFSDLFDYIDSLILKDQMEKKIKVAKQGVLLTNRNIGG